MANQLLLVEDVEDLGRSGDLVKVRPGYARNFLLPQQKAVIADKRTLRMQIRLKQERAERAAVDKKEAEILAQNVNGMELTISVKVDPEGHMYGSVGAADIARLFEEKGHVIEKRNVVLPLPIKALGTHNLSLKLKEGVPATFVLTILAEAKAE